MRFSRCLVTTSPPILLLEGRKLSTKSHQHDVLVIGSGAAGMTLALKLSADFQVAMLCKDVSSEGSTYYAQGGVAAVLDEYDSTESHIP